eukprot:7960799-Alexandrium_andersonii.AAC.1
MPKHHLSQHMVNRMSYLGNPKDYANFQDESLNKKLKAACSGASQLDFEGTVLTRMMHVLKKL